MKNRHKLYISILLSIFFVLAVAELPFVKVLSISNRKNKSERYFIKADELNGFEISYTHSVNKGRVHDYYDTTQNEGLILTSTKFVSYGAGIPEPIETQGAQFTVTDDGYIISNLQRKVPKLTMAVGIIANHILTINNTDFIMTTLFAPQTSIIFEKKRVSLVEYRLHRLNRSN